MAGRAGQDEPGQAGRVGWPTGDVAPGDQFELTAVAGAREVVDVAPGQAGRRLGYDGQDIRVVEADDMGPDEVEQPFGVLGAGSDAAASATDEASTTATETADNAHPIEGTHSAAKPTDEAPATTHRESGSQRVGVPSGHSLKCFPPKR